MNQFPDLNRFCMMPGGEVYFGLPLAGDPNVHDLIVSGDLTKALELCSKGAGDRVLDGVRGDGLSQKIPIPLYLKKSKTWSGHRIRKRIKFQGLDISIESPAGSYRQGVDPDGKPWRSLLHFDYGYIRGTTGIDKDHVDCFIGPYKDSTRVFVIHQKNVKTGAYDEDKVMLGWRTKKTAVQDYLKNYNRSDQIMGVATMAMPDFKTKVAATKKKPRMIKAVVRPHTRRLKTGRIVQVRQYEDTRTRKPVEIKPRPFKGMNLVEVGAVPTGAIKIPGRPISDAADIAGIFKGMKDEAREKYWVVGAGKAGKVASVELHSMGGIGSSQIDPRVIVSVLRANKAKKYWGIHNHPSGQSSPSADDFKITNRIRDLAKKYGIEYQDDIIIHGGKDTYTVFNTGAAKTIREEQRKAGGDWKEHPISELKVTGRGNAPTGMPTNVGGPADAAKIGKWIQSKYGTGVWAICLNGANQVAGFYLLGDNRIGDPATRSRYGKALLKHMMDTGSVSCITVGTHGSKTEMHKYHSVIKAQLESTDYNVLDSIFATDEGYYSVGDSAYTKVAKAMLIKAVVRAHPRRMKSGKVVQVRQHQTRGAKRKDVGFRYISGDFGTERTLEMYRLSDGVVLMQIDPFGGGIPVDPKRKAARLKKMAQQLWTYYEKVHMGKSTVRAHPRKIKTGKVVQVRQYETSRSKELTTSAGIGRYLHSRGLPIAKRTRREKKSGLSVSDRGKQILLEYKDWEKKEDRESVLARAQMELNAKGLDMTEVKPNVGIFVVHRSKAPKHGQPVPPDSMTMIEDHLKTGGRLAIPTHGRMTIITKKVYDKWTASGVSLLKPEGTGYRMRQGRGSVYLFRDQLIFLN